MSGRGHASLAALAAFALLAIFADLLPYRPDQVRSESGVEVLRPPSARHWLGTDDVGRDVATRLAHGARTSLLLAAGALALALLLGTALGAAAAAGPRLVDAAVSGACDLVAAVPALLLVVAAQGLLGRASTASLLVLLALPQIVVVARVARAEIRRVFALPLAEAARAVGATRVRVVARHALPLAAPPLAVCAAATVAATVLGEAALTFLGFGVPAGAPSWGELLRQAHQNALAWWLAVPAGAAVTLVSLAAHTLADELNRSS
jgi:ABC-type dipeptide/oligopeptide/nickel transport system permease subunit